MKANPFVSICINLWIIMAVRRIKSPLLWLLGLLLAVMPVLALLQWRWIGTISDHEAEHLRLHIRTAATYSAWNGNNRLMELQQLFSIPAVETDSALTAEISEAWNLWKQHQESALVSSIYVVRGPEKLLFRFDFSSDRLFPADMNDLDFLGIDIKKIPPYCRVTKGLRAVILPLFSPRVNDQHPPISQSFVSRNLLLPPTLSRQERGKKNAAFSYQENRRRLLFSQMPTIIVVLDSLYIRNRFLPSLVRPYFQNEEFRWAVVEKSDSSILSASPSLSANNTPSLPSTFKDFSKPDVAVSLCFIPPRLSGRISRAMTELIRRMPLVLAEENDTLWKNDLPSFATPKENRTEKNIDSSSLMIKDILGTAELRVVAARGSLEREVEALRWRNLAVSFGALFILTGGLVVVFTSVLRSERLRFQQMQFVAGVSHELRTPLAVLHSASENLADGIVRTPEQAKRYGQVMKKEIARLIGMTEQTLTFAGIQSGRNNLDRQLIEPEKLIEECLQRNDHLISGEGFTMQTHFADKVPLIFADARGLGAALDNLLVNAIKYSTDKFEICITISNDKEECVFAIQDFGRGIAAKQQKRIFEPFYRTNDVIDAQIQGNGLGLAIVQHIVKQHGGSVSVESELGKGSIFRLHLPIAAQERKRELQI